MPTPTLGTVSPTALAHRSSHIVLAKASGRVPALVALPKGTLVERGRHPPGPCSRDLVSAKCFPVCLAAGSQGGMGAKHQRPCPRARWWSRGATHRALAQGARCQPKFAPARLAEGSRGGSGRGTGTPLPKGSCRGTQSLPRLSPCSRLSCLCIYKTTKESELLMP